jgi:hypothetical protein
MNLIFQTWAHIKKDLLIYETPLAQIMEFKMKRLALILLLVLISCGKEESNDSEQEAFHFLLFNIYLQRPKM